jgi:hypothetical protein
MDAFVADLTRAIADVVARHHAARAGSRAFRLVVGAYPEPADEPVDDLSAGATPALA